MKGRSPKVGPKPDEGPKPKSGVEAQKWGRSPIRSQNPKAGPKARCSKSGVGTRCRAEARCSKCGVGVRCRAKARCRAGTQCSKCVLDKKVQEMRKEMSMLRNSAGHCKAVTLIFLAVLLCGARMGT
ncbi:hypothetical protein CRG98_011628 [Punica granatum]|uniref:Uncharacterized protein n=1 Tax=Punica granatum TaxID=22663 RepID=A0A2I0KHM9_PUNGR|nr:hypothetical protein CRG98_011628 [Punica granatum]